MIKVVIAYLLAFFLVGGLGVLIGSLVSTPFMLLAAKIGNRLVTFLFGSVAGFISGWVAIFFTAKVFDWLDVDFGFLALLTVFIPILSNDIKRARSFLLHEVAILVGTSASFALLSFYMVSK